MVRDGKLSDDDRDAILEMLGGDGEPEEADDE